MGNWKWLLPCFVLALAGFATAFTLVWDDDIQWHIAGGQWMIDHGTILRTDPFAVGDAQGRPNEWVNVHWLFQLLVAGVYHLAGFAGISVFRASLAAAWMLLFAIGLRRHAGPGWLIAAGLLALAVIAGRIRARPETFTLLFLLLTILVVESVREGAPARRLWLLVPVMLVWANMHVLCVLALGVLAAAVASAWVEARLARKPQLAGNLLSRQAMLAVLAVVAACLVTPWPGRTFTHAGLLATRLSGAIDTDAHSAATGPQLYSVAIDELHPTWDDFLQEPSSHPALAGTLIATLAVLALNYRRVHVAQVIWLLAFTGLAALARRNIALVGPVCGYLLVGHGGPVLQRLRGRWPVLNRLGAPAAVAAGVLALVVAGAHFTEWVFRVRSESQQIGAGLQPCVYPVESARFLGRLQADGAVDCDNLGDAGAFIQFSWPRRQVWMDGRLEVHSRERLYDHLRTMFDLADVRTVETARVPDSVRFIVVRSKADAQLCAMSHSRRFVLIHVARDAACFARVDWPAGTAMPGKRDIELPKLRAAAAALTPGPILAPFDLPLSPDAARVEGFTQQSWHWYRQNPWPYAYDLGELLLAIGRRPPGWTDAPTGTQRRALVLAARYLTAALAEDARPVGFRLGLAAKANQELGTELALEAEQARAGRGENPLPVNLHLAATLNLYERMDMRDIDDPNVLLFAVQRGLALYLAGQWEAADSYLGNLLAHLSDPEAIVRHRVKTRRERYAVLRQECEAFRHTIAARLAASRRAAADAELDTHDRLSYARTLRDSYGLAGLAGEVLQAAQAPSDAELLLLGDIRLQAGNARDARAIYARIPASSPQAGPVKVRLALCQWIEGDLASAGAALDEAVRAGAGDQAAYYRALLAELTGHYDVARRVLASPIAAADGSLSVLSQQLSRRLDNP